MILALILAAAIGIAHNLSDRFCIICSQLKIHVISFVAGISTVYVFMNLYPEFYRAAGSVSPLLFISVLLGFSMLHLIDKRIFQNHKHVRVSYEIRIAHGYGLIFYYFVVGIALVQLLSVSLREGILFFVPVFIYSATASMAHSIHGSHGPHYKTIQHIHVLQSFAVLVGTMFALLIPIPESVRIFLVGLVAGILTYVVVRDMLPKGKKGAPIYFIIGAIIYLNVIIIMWYI